MVDNILYIDSETTGLPPRQSNWRTDYKRFPHIVQLSWMMNDIIQDYIVKPIDRRTGKHYLIPKEVVAIHGIDTEKAMNEGKCLEDVLDRLLMTANKANIIVGFNVYFDTSMIKSEVMRCCKKNMNLFIDALHKDKRLDLMRKSTSYCNLKKKNGTLKFPKLSELYRILFNEEFKAHNSREDIIATKRCYQELVKIGIISNNQEL